MDSWPQALRRVVLRVRSAGDALVEFLADPVCCLPTQSPASLMPVFRFLDWLMYCRQGLRVAMALLLHLHASSGPDCSISAVEESTLSTYSWIRRKDAKPIDQHTYTVPLEYAS